MISKTLSEYYFTVNKDKKSFLINERPILSKVDEERETYAYVHEIGHISEARLYKADSDIDALIKAEKQMVNEGHLKAIIGMYLGKDENDNKIFKDLVVLRATEAINEVLSNSLSKEISSQAVRFGIEHQKGSAEDRVKLNGALSMLSVAQSMNEDNQARKLLNLAKRMATSSVKGIIEPVVVELKKLKDKE